MTGIVSSHRRNEPTVLHQEEAAFREWPEQSPSGSSKIIWRHPSWVMMALYEELTGPRADYDYRGAWKAGVGAQDYEFDDNALALVHGGRKDAEKPETPLPPDGVFLCRIG